MNTFQVAVQNALSIYCKTSGCTMQEAGARFADNEETRECIYMLVVAQADNTTLTGAAS